MKIAVVGAGGVGGPFGAALALAGEDVTFVARGAHLEAMRRTGLRIEGDRGKIHLQPVKASDDPRSIGPVDIVLFCVKLWDVESAGAAIKGLIGPETGVIPLQNGVNASDRLAAVLGPGAVMGGTAYINTTIAEPGLIRQIGPIQRLLFGELDGRKSARGERFFAACKAAGIDADFTQNLPKALWEKFIFLVAMSGMTALTRLPIGKFRDDPDTIGLFVALAEETAAVGRAAGVPLAADVVESRIANMRALPPGATASMAHDLAKGSRLELPWLGGKVVSMGRDLGVPTPVNAFIYGALKPYVDGRPA
ncbi:MAG: 2-dehydropantoate 2-reductase [Alphaproteobacteria bacterium]|nr:2-dehydropantoate 2-reductase [Alphaproteobacteria bacterium]